MLINFINLVLLLTYHYIYDIKGDNGVSSFFVLTYWNSRHILFPISFQ